jgi:dTDP-4-dehydrorhamnose 3,5-epimerase
MRDEAGPQAAEIRRSGNVEARSLGIHGRFVTRALETEVAYKVTALYAPECDRSLAWNDPALGIDWGVPSADATLSDKDRRAPLLADLGPAF